MTELHVVEHPVSGGPLVVLVHGAMDRSTSFHRVTAALDDVSVLAYDRRGYARSRFASPPAESVADHVDDLLELLDGRAAVVVGHSYGGVVALAAAVRRPDLVRSVGAYEAPMPWLPEWPQDTAGGEALRAALSGGDSAAAVEAFLRRMLGNEGWEMLPLRAKEDRRGEGPALLSDMRSLRGDPAPLDPALVTVPVVVGYGSRSRAHHIANTERLARLLPDAEVYGIEGASHGAHSSHPEEFAAFVRHAVARAR
ncbi:MAG TPA: alpha/beta hydrolase [Acidimicrobiales bacterium]|nr:alpha/beta hydrolase [Acidimicrobiales bacterium]